MSTVVVIFDSQDHARIENELQRFICTLPMDPMFPGIKSKPLVRPNAYEFVCPDDTGSVGILKDYLPRSGLHGYYVVLPSGTSMNPF